MRSKVSLEALKAAMLRGWKPGGNDPAPVGMLFVPPSSSFDPINFFFLPFSRFFS